MGAVIEAETSLSCFEIEELYGQGIKCKKRISDSLSCIHRDSNKVQTLAYLFFIHGKTFHLLPVLVYDTSQGNMLNGATLFIQKLGMLSHSNLL